MKFSKVRFFWSQSKVDGPVKVNGPFKSDGLEPNKPVIWGKEDGHGPWLMDNWILDLTFFSVVLIVVFFKCKKSKHYEDLIKRRHNDSRRPTTITTSSQNSEAYLIEMRQSLKNTEEIVQILWWKLYFFIVYIRIKWCKQNNVCIIHCIG